MRVRIGARVFDLNGDEPFTFGRASTNTVCLDPGDLGVSRQAGSILFRDGLWLLVNGSRTNHLYHYHHAGGSKEVVRPRKRRILDGPCEIWVDGSRKRYPLVVEMPDACLTEDPGETEQPSNEEPTAMGTDLFPHERAALAILFEPYFQRCPREDPRPRSYDAAAHRLHVRPTTLRRRIDHLRERLTKAGVPNLTGDRALENLAVYVLSRKLIDPPDGRTGK
jgi:hypothetical protein